MSVKVEDDVFTPETILKIVEEDDKRVREQNMIELLNKMFYVLDDIRYNLLPDNKYFKDKIMLDRDNDDYKVMFGFTASTITIMPTPVDIEVKFRNKSEEPTIIYAGESYTYREEPTDRMYITNSAARSGTFLRVNASGKIKSLREL